ncbi:MAG: hypothetical protein ACRC7O_16040, partial [Fimbriiglobus sp.]
SLPFIKIEFAGGTTDDPSESISFPFTKIEFAGGTTDDPSEMSTFAGVDVDGYTGGYDLKTAKKV